MSAIEESLRRAILGGDAASAEFRLSVYEASQRAMERMIAAKSLSPAEAGEQRQRLANAIAGIEADYGTFDAADGQAASPDEPVSPASQLVEEIDEGEPVTLFEKLRHSWKIFAAAAAIIFLALLVVIYTSIFPATQAPVEADPEEPTAAVEQEGPIDLTWINIFSGSNIEALATPAGGLVESIAAHGKPAVRMEATGTQGNEVLLKIGPGLVGELAGETVRFEVTAGSPDLRPREFSVRCLFADASICERQRFATSMPEEAFVFDIAVPADVASPANLAIGPGTGGEGPDIDLYTVRVRVLG
ncbi:hypothetical protein FPY71_04820 [Aureimonas fodinaquatilis]|uniref:Uncharacterized protein n=1 Tax=Aureimonas fodinaquatilis TaxID=2565783 RepID=A0A5B0E033_9HYPH|nr:hypothetical protein [Aureimonas fodinaquatilis]KAA0972417.1 hypothetical protein FPY71_04820 [Aureimonas fodinaquatilis]